MKKCIYKKMKLILICFIVFCTFLLSFFGNYSLAEFKFKDLQKKAADLDGDGNINYKDMEILVDQDFPQRPKDGVKNQSGEGYLLDLFSQSSFSRGSSTIASGDVIKVLMIGNSYTYYCDTGGMLAELAHRAGYRIIVVNAVHGSYYGKQFLNSHKLWTYVWDYSGDKIKTINKHSDKNGRSLLTIAKDNYGQNRAGKWDYIFIQDQKFKESDHRNADKKTFENLKSMLPSTDRFIFNANIGSKKKPNKYRKKGGIMTSFTNGLKCGIIYSGEIIGKSSANWKNDLKFSDGDEHPTAKAQYINACVMYAKIFGKDKLANSQNPSSFIEAYNSEGGNFTNFVEKINPSLNIKGSKKWKHFVKRYKISVNRREAIDFQYLVYRYYEQYVI